MVLFLFIIGLFLGSFLGVVIDRSNLSTPFWHGRSRCDRCKHILTWYDLIPLLSFMYLSGKCRYCHEHVSYFYPFIEILTGLSFVLTYVVLSPISLTITAYYMFIVCILIIVFFADLKYTIIPFGAVVPATLVAYVYMFFFAREDIFFSLISAIGSTAFFYILYLITMGRGMGFGDVVYVFFMGSVLGFPRILIGLYISFILGAVIGVAYLFIKKKKLKGAAIPFGPFLVLGTYIALILPSATVTSLLRFFHP